MGEAFTKFPQMVEIFRMGDDRGREPAGRDRHRCRTGRVRRGVARGTAGSAGRPDREGGQARGDLSAGGLHSQQGVARVQ